ncbi:MAG: S-layer homology domain-containing protein [Bacillota bacterium]|nr:S-layer homology domain-containing protein [Bacillota bacterium]
MKRKLISLFLVLILMLTLIPVGYAEASQQEAMVEKAMSYEGDKCDAFPDVAFDWCVYYVTYVANELGLSGTAQNPTGGIFPPIAKSTWGSCNWAATGVTYQINWFTQNDHGKLYYFSLNRYINTNSNTLAADRYEYIPQPGDLIYFNTPEHGSYCHVALVTEFDPGNGNVFYIGGNQDDMDWRKSHVSCRTANIYTDKVCAFLRPNYTTKYTFPLCSSLQECLSADFTDVTTLRWYHEDLDYVMSRGLFYGTSETTFSPYDTMTRGMMVTVLYRLEGSPDVSEIENPFTDVNDDTWCLDAVKWAYSTGVSEGFTDGSFGTSIEITRAQAAKMLYGYACFKELDTSAYAEFDGFADVDRLGQWAYDSMHWALGSGIINGTSASTITPNGNATRCQLAAIFARYMRYYEL